MEVTIAQHLTKAKVMAVEVGNQNTSRQKVYAFYTRVKSFYFSYQGQIILLFTPGSNHGSYTSGIQGVVAIFTGSGVVDGHDSDW